MQMALIVIFGYVVASSPPVYRLVQWLATIPKTPRTAVAWIALFATVSSLLSWGFSLVFSGLLVREVVRRVPQTDYRAAGAAGYLGLGSVWALGLSSSAALLMATKGSIPASLLPISGVLPLSRTIFLWQSIVAAVVLMAVSVLVARSEEHTSELQSPYDLVCRLLLEKKKNNTKLGLSMLNIIITHISVLHTGTL